MRQLFGFETILGNESWNYLHHGNNIYPPVDEKFMYSKISIGSKFHGIFILIPREQIPLYKSWKKFMLPYFNGRIERRNCLLEKESNEAKLERKLKAARNELLKAVGDIRERDRTNHFAKRITDFEIKFQIIIYNDLHNEFNAYVADTSTAEMFTTYINDNSLPESIEEKVIAKGGFGSISLVKRKDGGVFVLKKLEKTKFGLPVNNEIVTNLIASNVCCNVVKIRNTYEDNEHVWLEMDYYPLGALTELLNTSTVANKEDIRDLFEQCLRIVSQLHTEAGILHLDIKPDNFLVSQDKCGKYVVHLTDFGISMKMTRSRDMEVSKTGAMGTPGYMGPELENEKLIGPPSDVFSLGKLFQVMIFKNIEKRDRSGSDYDGVRNEVDLINRMTDSDWTKRPTLAECLDSLILKTPLQQVSSTPPRFPVSTPPGFPIASNNDIDEDTIGVEDPKTVNLNLIFPNLQSSLPLSSTSGLALSAYLLNTTSNCGDNLDYKIPTEDATTSSEIELDSIRASSLDDSSLLDKKIVADCTAKPECLDSLILKTPLQQVSTPPGFPIASNNDIDEDTIGFDDPETVNLNLIFPNLQSSLPLSSPSGLGLEEPPEVVTASDNGAVPILDCKIKAVIEVLHSTIPKKRKPSVKLPTTSPLRRKEKHNGIIIPVSPIKRRKRSSGSSNSSHRVMQRSPIMCAKLSSNGTRSSYDPCENEEAKMTSPLMTSRSLMARESPGTWNKSSLEKLDAEYNDDIKSNRISNKNKAESNKLSKKKLRSIEKEREVLLGKVKEPGALLKRKSLMKWNLSVNVSSSTPASSCSNYLARENINSKLILKSNKASGEEVAKSIKLSVPTSKTYATATAVSMAAISSTSSSSSTSRDKIQPSSSTDRNTLESKRNAKPKMNYTKSSRLKEEESISMVSTILARKTLT